MKHPDGYGFLSTRNKLGCRRSSREENPGEMHRQSMPSPYSIVHSEIAHHRLA
jgi:hypothetical protein